jgi:hypothetical protein
LGHSVPKQTRATIDPFVGKREQRGWNFKAKRLGGLEIDRELKFGRLHDVNASCNNSSRFDATSRLLKAREAKG